MDPERDCDRRSQADRRRPTRPWDHFTTSGRRSRRRRTWDLSGRTYQLVDRHGVMAGIQSTLLLVLTLIDGAFTVVLIDSPQEEANPFMAFTLRRGVLAFFAVKYAITAASLPVLLIYRDYPILGSRFRVGYLMPIFIGLYLMLLTCQIGLLWTVEGDTRARSAAAIGAAASTWGTAR